ncbi:MAG: polymer-forming cytoskeletal protein [Gammaproteobacteria bacterium]|jgi:cytoskeletal protein CcmA (bactofilin family)|nr:polymer-forming cytoskeletal protein [Gammaproteobacteria bacterium]MDG2338485.1 polymer-forming cytoskeletal protein [Gammaproteobacteria bacterium]
MFKNATLEKTSTGPAHTLISRSTEIVGDIHFTGELIIEGRVKGNIYADDESQALIRIAEKGSVEGEVCVPSAIVNGLVQGDLRSSNHLELAAKAVVVGSVYYNLIEMVMGSEVNGNLMHISTSQNENKRLAAEKKKLPFDSSVIQSS